MESQLGADFSEVRVHTGADSAKASTDLGARAFTVDNQIHFSAGQFAPGTREGDRLLAHELTHVAQGQKGGVQRKADSGDDLEVSQPHDPAEREADAAGDEVVAAIHDGKKSAPSRVSAHGGGVKRKVHLAEDPNAKNDAANAPADAAANDAPNAEQEKDPAEKEAEGRAEAAIDACAEEASPLVMTRVIYWQKELDKVTQDKPFAQTNQKITAAREVLASRKTRCEEAFVEKMNASKAKIEQVGEDAPDANQKLQEIENDPELQPWRMHFALNARPECAEWKQMLADRKQKVADAAKKKQEEQQQPAAAAGAPPAQQGAEPPVQQPPQAAPPQPAAGPEAAGPEGQEAQAQEGGEAEAEAPDPKQRELELKKEACKARLEVALAQVSAKWKSVEFINEIGPLLLKGAQMLMPALQGMPPEAADLAKEAMGAYAKYPEFRARVLNAIAMAELDLVKSVEEMDALLLEVEEVRAKTNFLLKLLGTTKEKCLEKVLFDRAQKRFDDNKNQPQQAAAGGGAQPAAAGAEPDEKANEGEGDTGLLDAVLAPVDKVEEDPAMKPITAMGGEVLDPLRQVKAFLEADASIMELNVAVRAAQEAATEVDIHVAEHGGMPMPG